MSTRAQQLHDKLIAGFTGRLEPELDASIRPAEVSVNVPPGQLLDVASALHDDEQFQFTQLTDLCGIDYSTYGIDEWETETRAGGGFSRAVESASIGRLTFNEPASLPDADQPRFAVIYHLLSVSHNVRLRLRCHASDDDLPVVPSVTSIWDGADWYEREAFDLFGILFSGHNDLRRLLTDYGFVGYPFRKDFPLIGNVEMRFDPARGRVVYEPVSIEPRVLVPRVIRSDSRYASPAADAPVDDVAES